MDFFLSNCERLLPKPFGELLGRARSSSIAARLIHGSLWSIAGSLLSRVMALAAALLVARVLGKAVYGELGLVQSTIGMFGGLSGFAMAWAVAKYVAEFRNTDQLKVGKIITLASFVTWGTGILCALILFFISPWLAQNTFAAPELTPYIQLSGLMLLLNAVNGTQTGILSGFEAFRKIAWVNGITGLFTFALVVSGALLFELSGVIWGMILAQAIGCLFNAFVWKREAARLLIPKVSWSVAISELPLLFQFALPTMLGSLLINPVIWVCTAMLARQANGLEHVGAFSAASQWFGAIMWLPYVISSAVLPVLSERIGAKDTIRSVKLVVTFFKINVATTLPIVIVGSLLSRHIMGAYGEDFSSDWPTLVVSLVTCVAVAAQVPVTELITASGRMWLALGINLLWAAVFILAASQLVQLGAVGLAWARFLAYTIQAVLGWVFAMWWIRTYSGNAQVVELLNNRQ